MPSTPSTTSTGSVTAVTEVAVGAIDKALSEVTVVKVVTRIIENTLDTSSGVNSYELFSSKTNTKIALTMNHYPS